MLPSIPGKDVLSSCRPVESNGRRVLNIHYVDRENVEQPNQNIHSVSRIQVINEYELALSFSWSQLTSPDYGWPEIQDATALPRDVLVCDLHDKFLGVAVDPIGGRSHLVLNSRTLDVPEIGQYKLRAVAARELVHLFQYCTPAYQYWPVKHGRAGEKRDPNWWLHEATALALETQLAECGPAVCAPLFWTWATSPERSIDSDTGGTLAAPFLIYLMRQFGTGILSEIYRLTEDEVPGMRGCEMIAHVLSPRGFELAATDGKECFASGYCVEAAFLGDSDTCLPGEWNEITGPRALSGRFASYPVPQDHSAYTVDHLGCRYFEFRPTEDSNNLEIGVKPQRTDGIQILRCEAVTVGHDGKRQQTQLNPIDTGEFVGTVGFNTESHSRVVLVVANCAYEAGFSRFDQLPFQIRASIE